MKREQLSGDATGKGTDTPRRQGSWDRVEVFHSGDSFFEALEAAIKAATRCVYLETYIFATDRLGHRILTVLGEAVTRGVEVRVIVDGIGSMSWAGRLRQEAAARSIQIKIFHELPWTRWWKGKIALRRMTLARAFRRINHRNHRKVCIVDERTAFVGSMNVIEYHLRECVGDSAWRDAGVLIEGGEVAILVASFEELWSRRPVSFKLVRSRHRIASSGKLVKLNVRRSQRRENYLDILVRIIGAKRRVWIENAYFVPDGSLVRALSVAAQSGVDVRIVVPAVSDVIFIPWVTAAFHDALLRAGARVFEYTKAMLHAKTILIDDWGLVGSSNLNHRSLLHDLEADVVLGDEAACISLENQFQQDCLNAREITIKSWKERPLLERMLGRLLLMMRRFM